MGLVLEVVLIICMFLWLLAALPVPASSWAAPYHPLLAWISVAIICYFMFTDGTARRAALELPHYGPVKFSDNMPIQWLPDGGQHMILTGPTK
jgi:hypothetical protein